MEKSILQVSNWWFSTNSVTLKNKQKVLKSVLIKYTVIPLVNETIDTKIQ